MPNDTCDCGATCQDIGGNRCRYEQERDRLREALVKIQKLSEELDGDGYEDIDALQVFENSVSDIVELVLSKPVQ